jgi:hypothetical protein
MRLKQRLYFFSEYDFKKKTKNDQKKLQHSYPFEGC